MDTHFLTPSQIVSKQFVPDEDYGPKIDDPSLIQISTEYKQEGPIFFFSVTHPEDVDVAFNISGTDIFILGIHDIPYAFSNKDDSGCFKTLKNVLPSTEYTVLAETNKNKTTLVAIPLTFF